METTQSLARKLAILPTRIYQLMVSPLFPPYCHPRRTLGYDPVPRKLSVSAASGLSGVTSLDVLEETDRLELQFDKRGGLIPVIMQESSSGQILMQAYANQEAFEYTRIHGKAAFWSTSRNELWIKGASSGNTLSVDRILVDCDQDALIYQVTLDGGGVCHTIGRDGRNRKACFYRDYDSNTGKLRFIRGME